MRIEKPEKQKLLKKMAGPRHPTELPGTRWMPTIALSPANLLQLQQAAGNQAVIDLLRRHSDPTSGSLSSLKVYRAARKDQIVPLPGVDSEALIKSQGPRFGNWNFQFVADESGTVMYWVTLDRYKNRQRHILIDAATKTPLEVTGADLDQDERKQLMEWAIELLSEHLIAQQKSQALPQEPSDPSTPNKEEEEEMMSQLLGDGEDDDLNLLGSLLIPSLRTKKKKKKK